MFDPGSLKDLSVGAALLFALWLVLKYKPWERTNGNGSDKKVAGYLVDIAKYAEDIGDMKRDIHELHVMFFGIDGQGGFAQEINRLRTWREQMEGDHQNMQLRISRLENRRRSE